ncbi:MAG: amidohydrolase family protein [Planctomycetes bacterium]|nr:amidohydrolase family protein [Planctomycetota bacterium]
MNRILGTLALASLFLAPLARGQEPEPAADPKKPDDKHKTEETWFAVTGGDVYTGDGSFLRGATVLAHNGKIERIGFELDFPADTKKLDATGYRVYPGLVAISSSGLLGNSSSEFEDTIDPFSQRMILGLASGITSTGVGNSAVKLERFRIAGAVLRDRIYSTFSWSSRNPSGKQGLRDKFRATADYMREYRDWEEKVKKDKELKEPPKKGVDNAVLSVLRGDTIAKFNAGDRDDLLGIARLAQDYGFRPVIDGCQEGWTVADELGRAGAMAIVTARDRRPKDEHQVIEGGTNIQNASLLYRAGVPIAIAVQQTGVDLSGLVGRDIMGLTIEAGFAVRGGLPEAAAIASITIVPARLLGVSHRVGSIEVGKDCDLIITDGDLLHYNTFVQWAIVDGRIAYDKQKELFFAQIRPRPEPTVAVGERKLDKGESKPEAGKDEADKSGEEKPKEEKPKEEKPKEGREVGALATAPRLIAAPNRNGYRVGGKPVARLTE